MATISNVTLGMTATPNGDWSVQVKGTMDFTAGDVGKTYQLGIKLVGIDNGDDPTAANDPGGSNDPPIKLFGPQTLYTFQFGLFSLAKTFKSIVVTEAGPKTFTEKRTISSNTL